jgi:glyoxylase-like metal-dependent hydrolase (beta-lactamase superfamily II)
MQGTEASARPNSPPAVRDEWVARAEWIHERVALLEVFFWQQHPVALYLVERARRLLIDSGGPDTPERALEPALAKIGRQLRDINVIINTHAHLEHVGGNSAVLASTDAKVLMHAAELPSSTRSRTSSRLSGTTRPSDHRPNGNARDSRPSESGRPPAARARRRRTERSEMATSSIWVTASSSASSTPPGSICLHWDRSKSSSPEDAVTGNADSRWFYFEDPQSHRNSLERLQGLPVQIVCPAHRYSFRLLDRGVVDPARRGTHARRFLSDSPLLTALDLWPRIAAALWLCALSASR